MKFVVWLNAQEWSTVGEGPPSYAECRRFADAPDYDIVLIPGGFGTRAAVHNPGFLAQLSAACKKTSTSDRHGAYGSALLARTGRFNGRPATSNKIAWNSVIQQGPRVHWIRQARWVDDGTIISSSGSRQGSI